MFNKLFVPLPEDYSSSPLYSMTFAGPGGNHLNPNQTGPTSSLTFGGSNHPNPSQTGLTFFPSWHVGGGGGDGYGNHLYPLGFTPNPNNPFTGHPPPLPSPPPPCSLPPPPSSLPPPPTTTTTDDGHLNVAPNFLESSSALTISPEEEAFISRTPSSSLTHPPPPPPLAATSPSSSSLQQPPVQDIDFEDEISSMTADKAFILKSIKRKHPLCLSSLRLRSKPQRQAAYDYLVQVIQDLKAIICGNGGPVSYDKVLTSLDDLEVYGFFMGWLRVEVRKLRLRSVEEEHLRKVSENLRKQIETIEAKLAAPSRAQEFIFNLFKV